MLHYSAIAGLGNPGKKYQSTRHNIGFMVVDAFVAAAEGNDGSWKGERKAEIAKIRFGEEAVLVIKPQSFMNLSGKPVRELLGYYKFEPDRLVVVQDDIDLPFGAFRIRQGGGDGGHNGIKSLSSELGNPNFARFKIGVGRPATGERESQNSGRLVSDWVLEPFSLAEQELMKAVLEKSVEVLGMLLREGLKPAQNRYNGWTPSPSLEK